MCLVPGVDTAFDDFNNPSDVKINSTRRALGCQQVANVIDCAPVCKNVEVVAMHCTSRISLILDEKRRSGLANFSPCDWKRVCQLRRNCLHDPLVPCLRLEARCTLLCLFFPAKSVHEMSNITMSKCSSGSETPSVKRNDSGGDLTVSHGGIALQNLMCK